MDSTWKTLWHIAILISWTVDFAKFQGIDARERNHFLNYNIPHFATNRISEAIVTNSPNINIDDQFQKLFHTMFITIPIQS